MKKAFTFIYAILAVCSTVCFAGKQHYPAAGHLQAGKVIDTIISLADASHSYAVYIPVTANNAPLPVIYFFDAHGAGALPLRKYKTLADEYGFILIGSNNSKNGNGWPATENIWLQMFNDTQKRLKINNSRVYACGFSGGAKAAGYIALKYPVIKGVIANGAGLPDGVAAGDFAFSFTALAGEGDMNMAGLVTFSNSLNSTRTRHRVIIFDGKHEWAPENIMGLAFASLQLDAMQQGLLAKNDAFVNSYIAGSKQRVDVFYTANHLIKAERECVFSISALSGLGSDADWFKNRAASVEGSNQYQKQQQAQQALLAKEQNLQAGYMQQFEQGSMDYWTKTIVGLQASAAAKTADGMMHQRLLAWLSLAFYSISNQLINSNQNEGARHFVELYKLADATNSEAWYFSAILYARGGKSQLAEHDLLKAVACGFNNRNRLDEQPEFKKLASAIHLSVIESKMTAN